LQQLESVLNKESIIAAASAEAFGKPLVNNVLRSIISEAIVDAALDDSWKWRSADWAGFDFIHADGTRLEVKQSAALQSWYRLGSKPSKGSFDIARRTGIWESGTVWIPTPGRNAELYVFAWHPETNPEVADHRDPDQWQFFVVPEPALSRTARTISLSAVRRLADPVDAKELNEAVGKYLKGKSIAAE
jgi:hypothetical protein